MSRLQLQRKAGDDKLYTPGVLSLDGKELCVTLEPGLHRAAHPAIPAGTYKMVLATSGHVYEWMRESLEKHATSLADKATAKLFRENGVPLLVSVPGRGGVEIHIGNKEADTLGCTLTGTAFGPSGTITGSTAAYFKVYPILLDYIKHDAAHDIQYIDYPKNA